MANIKDVARSARVSVATVSRVFNASHLVREDTRVRVRRAAGRLGYAPHGVARSLVTRRTHTIGVLLPDLYGEFFSEIIRGIDQGARGRGYHLLVANAREPGPDVEAALQSMRGRVDGLIVMSPHLDAEAYRRSLPREFPVVLLNCPPNDAGYDRLVLANYRGARAMTRHLASLGHRRIAAIRGPVGNFDAAERLRGYRAGLRAGGLPWDRALEVAGDFSEAAGHAAAETILTLRVRPTAVFAANDGMAIGALSAFREAGLRVPGELAVAGFDDIPMARYLHPALTSVRVDIAALGERAASRLLERFDGPRNRPPRSDILPTTLIVRESCGAPNAISWRDAV